MCADGFSSYGGLADRGRRHRYRARRGENELAERGDPGNRVNGVEGLWGFAEDRLVRYRGIAKEDSCLHLRGCGFRFDMRGGDMCGFPLTELRRRPLN